MTNTLHNKDWNIWIGPEIEGTTDLNVKTLFVRKWPDGVTLNDLKRAIDGKSIQRIWFCKEFVLESATKGLATNASLLFLLFEDWSSPEIKNRVAIEVDPTYPTEAYSVFLASLQLFVPNFRHYRLYVKTQLPQGDYEFTYCLKRGQTEQYILDSTLSENLVCPSDYLQDERLF